MNKQQEILILKATAAKLGKDSYLGPWIESIVAEVESMIKSDIFPDVNLSETAHKCSEQKLVVAMQADSTKKEAEKAAEKIIQDARNEADRIRSSVLYAMKAAINTLER